MAELIEKLYEFSERLNASKDRSQVRIQLPEVRKLDLLKALAPYTTAQEARKQQRMAATWDFCSNLDVNFESQEHALIAYTALAVDKELQPDKVKRVMSISNNKLSVHFEALEARFLRASFFAFLDVLTLATRTIQEFGQKN